MVTRVKISSTHLITLCVLILQASFSYCQVGYQEKHENDTYEQKNIDKPFFGNNKQDHEYGFVRILEKRKKSTKSDWVQKYKTNGLNSLLLNLSAKEDFTNTLRLDNNEIFISSVDYPGSESLFINYNANIGDSWEIDLIDGGAMGATILTLKERLLLVNSIEEILFFEVKPLLTAAHVPYLKYLFFSKNYGIIALVLIDHDILPNYKPILEYNFHPDIYSNKLLRKEILRIPLSKSIK